MFGTSYIKNMNNQSFMERLKNIASIATITISSNIDFIPSWDIKDKYQYTESSRRFIGKLIISGDEILCYYISNKKEQLYIKQMLFDINKSIKYDDIIIFVENLDVICEKFHNLSFGKQNTYIILNNEKNREIIKHYKNINLHDVIENMYKQEVLISNWNKADYLLEDGTYIVCMPFINTEKISRLNWYMQENTNLNKKIEVVSLEENIEKINELLDSTYTVKAFDKDFGTGGISEMECFKEDY